MIPVVSRKLGHSIAYPFLNNRLLMPVLDISVTKRKMAVSSFLLKSLILLYLILHFKKTPGNK